MNVQSQTHAIDDDKMAEIVGSILEGKYSSACLLLLEATGQEPLHYIPYRTYNRLQKQRQQAAIGAKHTSAGSLRKRMTDLDYLEALPERASSLSGGSSRYTQSFWPWSEAF